MGAVVIVALVVGVLFWILVIAAAHNAGNLVAKPAPAQKPAGGTAAKPAAGAADDLKQIDGVGPTIEKKLHALGYTSFRQIANLTAAEIAEIDEKLNFKGRIEREDWVGQARKLAG